MAVMATGGHKCPSYLYIANYKCVTLLIDFKIGSGIWSTGQPITNLIKYAKSPRRSDLNDWILRNCWSACEMMMMTMIVTMMVMMVSDVISQACCKMANCSCLALMLTWHRLVSQTDPQFVVRNKNGYSSNTMEHSLRVCVSTNCLYLSINGRGIPRFSVNVRVIPDVSLCLVVPQRSILASTVEINTAGIDSIMNRPRVIALSMRSISVPAEVAGIDDNNAYWVVARWLSCPFNPSHELTRVNWR